MKNFTSVRRTPMFSTLVIRPIAESCEISFRFILFLMKSEQKKSNENRKMLKILKNLTIYNTYLLSILAESSLGSIISTAHPTESLTFKSSNNSSLFSSFSVFESTGNQIWSKSSTKRQMIWWRNRRRQVALCSTTVPLCHQLTTPQSKTVMAPIYSFKRTRITNLVCIEHTCCECRKLIWVHFLYQVY